ncbi:MAG: ABC transporter permease [Sphingomonadales bacterium]|nr:ABC transporter permease [Sphingomonadales bacterium]
MMRYVFGKLLLTVPTLAILSVVIFALIRMVPGDPAVFMVGDLADAAALDEARRELGLDRPYAVQYFLWLGNVLSGDLGRSVMTGQPVTEAIAARFPVTAQVVLVAMALALLAAVPAGLFAGWRHNTPADFAVVLIMNIFLSIPSFWMGLMLILAFGIYLDWLPTVGYVSVADDLAAGLEYLIMPVLAVVFIEVATLTRMMRASTIEVLRQEYVTHARAKGLPERVVLARHVFKNAFAPTLTLMGLMLGSLLGGVAVIETVFTLPGIGRLLVDSIYARDYGVVQGVLLFVALTYVAVNLTVDLLYPVFDPRVRL